MSVREFKLANSNTERTGVFYSFMDPQHYLASPTGLGLNASISTITIGERDSVVSKKYAHQNISGKLYFVNKDNDKCYELYSEFLEFIRFGGLNFYYRPANASGFYFCEVEITNLSKSETESSSNALVCDISFFCISRWLDENAGRTSFDGNVSPTDGKHYDLVRDYYYGGTNFENMELNNAGYLDVGFEIKMEGECEDPCFYIFQEGKNVPYGKCKFIGHYGYVYVNSKDGEEEIRLERTDGSVVENPVSYQDMSLADGEADITFVKLKTGNSYLKVMSENFTGSVEVSWNNTYMSV